MEQTLLKVIDQSGILALSLVVLYFGGKKLDDLTKKIDCLCQLLGMELTKDGHGEEVKAILGEESYAALNGNNSATGHS